MNMSKIVITITIILALSVVAAPAYAAETPYELAWTRQLGTIDSDFSYSVAIDGSGNAYINGYTSGSLGGSSVGGRDAFLAKYDSSGSPLWTRQLGTSGTDESFSVAIDGSGNAYISGQTEGSLGGPNAGNADAFLAKFVSASEIIPEPSTLLLLAPALLGLAGLLRRKLR